MQNRLMRMWCALCAISALSMTRCGESADLRPPKAAVAVDVQAYEGRTQSAPAGSAVAVRPAVRAVDLNGQGVPGLTVTFRVIDGGGQVTGEVTTTNQEGVARLGGWVLGMTPGLNRVAARMPGLPEVLFEATGEAIGQPTLVAQAWAAGAALPVAPTVLARDAEGAPRAGLTVRFTVTGGGSIERAEATTGADGLASAGVWTLGLTVSAQSLTAIAEGLPAVTFTATALSTEAPTLDHRGQHARYGAVTSPSCVARMLAPTGAHRRSWCARSDAGVSMASARWRFSRCGQVGRADHWGRAQRARFS
jgi:hypothetical protein